MRSARLCFVASLALTACGSNTVQSPPTSADVPAVNPDGSVVGDAVTTVDGPITSDVVPTTDGPPGTDGAAAFPLTGLWRLTRYEFPEPGTGRAITLTDRDSDYTNPDTMMTTALRVNGLAQIDGTHLALTFGNLAAGHFYVSVPTSATDTGYGANGFGAPGLLDEARGEFTVPGTTEPTRIERNADGTISMIFANSDTTARASWSRATDSGPALPSINAVGLAMTRGASYQGMRPRLALFWDVRGETRLIETNGTALRFVGRFATYPVTLAGTPPAEAIGAWMGSQVAIAYLVVYDDVDDNTRFDQGTDRLDGLSPVVITWRAATPFTAPAGGGHFPLRLVGDGWRFGHVHLDYGLGRADVVGYDGTVPVSPDLPVARDISVGIPNVL